MRRVVSSCVGTCGELIEGSWQGKQVLVSLPVNLFSRMELGLLGESSSLADLKKEAPKSWQALQGLAAQRGIPADQLDQLAFHLTSDLPVGKGMSSSTADMCASMGALAAFFNFDLEPEEGSRLCQRVEATDSLLFPSLTLMDENDCSLIEESGWAPAFSLLLLEPEAGLDTTQFYGSQAAQGFADQAEDFAQVLALYRQAVAEESLDLLGQAASWSSALNQAIAPKPYFADLQALCQDFPVFGLVVAHSGTVLGLMIKDEDLKNQPDMTRRLEEEIRKQGLSSYYKRTQLLHTCYNGLDAYVSAD